MGENYELPLDINGMPVSFKKIGGMVQLPLFENDKVDPNKIRKFRLDLSQLTSTEIDIECEMIRFDYYFENKASFVYQKRDDVLAENNNDLINKILGFDDGVTDLRDAFNGSSVVSTPKMIVARNVTDFYNCFHFCYILASISSSLFDNCANSVTKINYCFYTCVSLTSVPSGLFDNCAKVIDFEECFHDCNSLTSVPSDLFDNCVNVEDFRYCFENCSSITSSLPDVWNKEKFPNVTNGSGYARGCTKAANYNEIPEGWK